jgi:hypothetical protein
MVGSAWPREPATSLVRWRAGLSVAPLRCRHAPGAFAGFAGDLLAADHGNLSVSRPERHRLSPVAHRALHGREAAILLEQVALITIQLPGSRFHRQAGVWHGSRRGGSDARLEAGAGANMTRTYCWSQCSARLGMAVGEWCGKPRLADCRCRLTGPTRPLRTVQVCLSPQGPVRRGRGRISADPYSAGRERGAGGR